MVRTLDARTSLASTGITPLNILLPSNTPTLLGIVGLNIVNPGPLTRTQFNGTYRFSVASLSSLPSTIRMEIFRGPLIQANLFMSFPSLYSLPPTLYSQVSKVQITMCLPYKWSTYLFCVRYIHL